MRTGNKSVSSPSRQLQKVNAISRASTFGPFSQLVMFQNHRLWTRIWNWVPVPRPDPSQKVAVSCHRLGSAST